MQNVDCFFNNVSLSLVESCSCGGPLPCPVGGLSSLLQPEKVQGVKEVGSLGYVVNVHQSCMYILSGPRAWAGHLEHVLRWALLVKSVG